MDEIAIPRELLESIVKNECILFVASGLSAKVTRSNKKALPNWNEFLIELLNWAKIKRVPFNSDPDEIQEMINKGNCLMAAEELQELINLNEFGEFLNDVFRDKNVKPTNVHQTLTKIPFRAILTTNYDALIEGAYTISSEGQIPKIFTPITVNSAISPLRKKEFFIFKMHGDINSPNSIVLGSRSYNNLLYKSPEYLSFLETLFTTQTVLFVGFGGSDPDLDYLIDRLSTIFSRTLNKHYILMPQGKFNFTEKRRLLLDRRLEVIDYNPENNHKRVDDFISSIYNYVEGNTIVVNDKQNAVQQKNYVLMVSRGGDNLRKINEFVDSIPNFEVTVWTVFDIYFDEENKLKRFDEVIEDDYEFKPSIALIILDKKAIKSQTFENELEQILLKELENRLSVIPIIIGDIEIPFKLRNYNFLRLPDNFTTGDLEELGKKITMHNTRL